MDFGLAFSYVFKDKDWFKKISIVALAALIPIIGQMVVYGWMMKIAKRVMDHNPDQLPELDFGDDLSRGLMGWIISLVYSLPMILIYGLFMIFALMGSAYEYDSTTTLAAGLANVVVVLFMIAYGLLLALILPAAFTKYLESNSLAEAFNIGAIFKLVFSNFGTYFLVLLGVLVVGFITPFGLIACFIGVLWTMTYGMAVQGHLYGQAYVEVNKPKLSVDIPPAS